jgi:hypothetical protein
VPALATEIPPPRRPEGRSFCGVRHGASFREFRIQSCTGYPKSPAWGTGKPDQQRGEYSPSLYLALKIAEYFEVPVEVIFSTALFPRIGSGERSA